ncbi:TonB-dependent hemoglobin/transferrin/lactoferrin family receptor [Ectothiorhodospira haloalkaliphila]|uniref:TonB-dependent hemoglobin/transferrin/lactoferrin family receptor n=1 Tax=Ectothiorhodospira haloalkaliphila TaxID=421628 RepID=UPI001EE795A5|nr:TonB-dependent hemoglobin/transferrin/lactoferrin family receptor [Ectothiorhodospira haloalkaliphila]MCG5525392.1 TonB-dependent hemoglobin/transferrin/lactoferrin family receptor [Ectothiorhodospira haloalkaliphila]
MPQHRYTVPVIAASLTLALPAHADTRPDHEQVASLTLPSIMVESTRVPTALDQLGAPVAVRDRATLDRDQAADLADVLNRMPGVDTSGGPRTTALQPVIRGLGGERVVIRVDGARQNFASGHKGRVFLDPFLLEQAEVLRGPSSSLYGSGALGGVVNFRTRDPESFLGDDAFGGRITAGYQDQGSQQLLSAIVAGQGERGSWLGSILQRDQSDLEDGDGDTIRFTGDDITSGLIKGTLRPAPDHRLTLSLQGFRDDHEIPSNATASGTGGGSAGIIVDRRTDSRTQTLRYQFTPDNDWVNLDATVYGNQVELEETRVDTDRYDETRLRTVGLDMTNTTWLRTGAVDHELLVGLEHYRDRQRGRRDGDRRPQYPDARQETTGVFITDRILIGERWEVSPGLRFDRFHKDADDQPSITESEWSGQLTATFMVAPGWDLFGGYSEAFRAPSLTNLYVGGVHFGNNFFEPNPDLKPEKARNKELGLSYHGQGIWQAQDQVRARLSIYQNDVEDYIDEQVESDPPVGPPPPGGPTGRTISENVRDARLRGQELEFQYLNPDYFVAMNASRIRGDNRTDGEPLSGIPADSLSLEGGIHVMGGQLTLGGRLTRAWSQDRVPDGGESTDGYTLTDLFMTLQPKAAGERLRLDFGIDNVTDKAYRPHLAAINDPGRNVKIQASYRF